MSNARDKANIPALNFSSTGIDDNATSTAITINSSESVGIGTTSQTNKLTVNGSSRVTGEFLVTDGNVTDGSGTSKISMDVDAGGNSLARIRTSSNGGGNIHSLAFFTGASEVMRYDSSGRLGIGTSSPSNTLEISGSGTGININSTNDEVKKIQFENSGVIVGYYGSSGGSPMRILDGSAVERMRIDSSGNLLISTTSTDSGTAGIRLNATGFGAFTRDSGQVITAVRLSNDGEIIRLKEDTTTIGSIGSKDTNSVYIENSNTGMRFYGGGTNIVPCGTAGAGRDNAINFGNASLRWSTIYAGTGSINTSDQNEKQSIQSLTTAEMNVGRRLSSLIKTFKFNDAVEEKGANARTHTGIIAQDVQQAFDDEGLDASNYALFCSDTWWEKEIYVDAVVEEVDENGNVITEAKDAYTYIDTKEEATDGYNEKTRLGVRYPELLSFIQAYNDQRFTKLEARITALEANNP